MVLNTIHEVEKFDLFCKEHGILNLYDEQNRQFPHYRIIKINQKQPVVAFWEVNATWKEGLFTTGIYINGGKIVTMEGLPQEFAASMRWMKEISSLAM